VRYVWIAIVLSAVPLVYVALLANPLVLVLFGVEWWLDRVTRLDPYRWWVLFLILVCAFSVAVYLVSTEITSSASG
jgi:hypothetical protein